MTDNTTENRPLAALTDAWLQMTQTAFRSATAVNRAAFATLDETRNGDAPEEREVDPASIPSLAFEDDDWAYERSTEDPDEIAVGTEVSFTKEITAEDVRRFAVVSGDTNRLHLDDEFAADSRFGGRIAHGTLVSGLISAALARLPGLTIYLSQDLEFRGPVEIGDRVTATVGVVEDLGNDQYRLTTTITDEEGTSVIEGEAVVLIDDLPEE